MHLGIDFWKDFGGFFENKIIPAKNPNSIFIVSNCRDFLKHGRMTLISSHAVVHA